MWANISSMPPTAMRAERFQRAGGDRVDADFLVAQVERQVARGRFQGGLGDAHDVVAGDDLFAAEVSHAR